MCPVLNVGDAPGRTRAGLSLANQVSATTRPHARRVNRAGRHIAPLTHAIGPALAIHRHRHGACKDDVRCFCAMRMIGIPRVGAILPHVRMRETLLLETPRKFRFVHHPILTNPNQCLSKNGYALPAALGDTAERALPSSGEKLVNDLQNQTPGGGGTSAGAPAGGAPCNPRQALCGPPGPPSFTV